MDYEAVGNSCVFRGAVLVAVGAVLFSAGWFLPGIYKQMSERLKTWRWFKAAIVRTIVILLLAGVLVLAGSIMVAKGGTLQTKGWNIISLGEQRSNLIRVLTQEWLMNSGKLLSSPMKGETHYKKEDGKYVRRFFPFLTSHAPNAILSSGLWNSGNQMDREFLDAVTNYEMNVTGSNREFRDYDDSLSKIKDPNESIMQTKEAIRVICEKSWFKSLKDWQNHLGKLIWSEYRWTIETQQPEVYELLRKRFQEKPTASEPAEALSKKKQ